jgi:hypothetical protein
MPAVIGRRSDAPRIVSERLGPDGRYTVALEGIAGRSYAFRLHAPGERGGDRTLTVEASAGSSAVAPPTPPGISGRTITITFPAAGANADGYTSAQIVFSQASARR